MGRNDEAITALQRCQVNHATIADVAVILGAVADWLWPEAMHDLTSRPNAAEGPGALSTGAMMEGLAFEINLALERAECLADAASRLEPGLAKHTE
jgi:hypothetical protein